LASQVQDDAFREIQLNGKQLVFLFMVATVVSVVIFFCGVFVGRGVRAERPALSGDTSASTPVTTPDAAAPASATSAAAGSDPTKVAPPQVADDNLTYPYRLEKSGQPVEDLKPAPREPAAPIEKPTPAKALPAGKPVGADAKAGSKPSKAVPTPGAPIALPPAVEAQRAGPAATDRSPAVAPPAEPAGQGFALQVTALRERNEAEAIAKRLSSKGYTAYVMTPARGTPSMYRVRVGKFKTRREAETMATKLKKEEQFTPWITR
jgi:DedD protein